MIHLTIIGISCFLIGRFLRKMNFPIAPIVLLGLMALSSMAITCTPATLQEIGNMIPSLASIVTGIITFISGLSGKTVPATTAADLQTDATDAQNEIANVDTVVTAAIAAKETPNATLMSTLQATFNAILGKVQSFVSNSGVKDPSTQNKLDALADIGIGVINTVLGVISGAMTAVKEHAAGRMTDENIQGFDKQMANHLKEYHKAAKQAWNTAIKTPTENADVNAVLATLKELK